MDVLRSCGRLETYSTARHHLGFYNNVGLTAYYTTSDTTEKSLKDIVFAVLHHVITSHPNLSAIPVDEDKSYPDVYFARLSDIDLDSCVQFSNRETPFPQGDEADLELDQLLRTQHDRNFAGYVKSRPYWRLIIASSPKNPGSFSASWIFHHALSDGSSAKIFHESFLDGLHRSADLISTDSIVQIPSTPLLPPLEELHPMSISWPFLLRAIGGLLLPTYLTARPADLWTGSTIDATVSTRVPSYNTTVVLSATATTLFAKKCRTEQTSVTAALITLLATVLSNSLAPGKSLKIHAPISLRPSISIDDNQMVNAVANHSSTLPCPTALNLDFSWPTARAVKTSLVQEVTQRGSNNPVALLKYVSNMHDYFTEKHGQQRDSSAEVSNLGVWSHTAGNDTTATDDADDEGGKRNGWKIGRVTFSQSVNRTGPPITLSAVTGPDGCMALCFNLADGGVEAQTDVEVVAQAIKRGVEALVG